MKNFDIDLAKNVLVIANLQTKDYILSTSGIEAFPLLRASSASVFPMTTVIILLVFSLLFF